MATPTARTALADRFGLNFIRPDVGRPGLHDFLHSADWLVQQFVELGVKWNRLAFSWVLVQPQPDVFNWEPYDRVVDACGRAGIQILPTLGGHFDRPPVPAWAGESLKQVVNEHPQYLERFVEAWVRRYHDRIHVWEILNEPKVHHKGLTVLEYVERILRPSYKLIKSIDTGAQVLACAFNNLPVVGDKEEFWDAARGHYDIHNHHQYQYWGYFLPEPTIAGDLAEVNQFRALIEKHGEADKPLWITEFGWFGSGSLTGTVWDTYKQFPMLWTATKPAYSGRETLTHPVVLREDALRARWLRQVVPALLGIPGCQKAFLWVSLDEFEGGYDPDSFYGRSTPQQPAKQVDLWGIIAGDKSWRKTAYTMQEMLR